MAGKIQQLQLLQQNLQNILLQKQQLQNQLLELESALAELRTTDQAYKIVGKIMIATSKEKLLQELEHKKEVQEVRLKNIIKQEEKLTQNIEDSRQEALHELKK